jgi:hypothetical protein
MGKHNSAPLEKAEIRALVKASMRPELCRVLETNSGPGQMRDLAWPDVQSVYGIDIDPYSVSECIGDSLDFLRREDLSRWNVFDIDPFGDYAEYLWIVSQRLVVAEPVAFICTDGATGGAAGMNPTMVKIGASRQMIDALGMRPSDSPKPILGRKGSAWKFGQLLRSFFPSSIVRERWQATNPHGGMHYHAAIIAPAGDALVYPAGRG